MAAASPEESSLTLRRATVADLDTVCRLVAAAAAAMRRAGIDQWDERYPDREVLEEDIRRQELRLALLDGDPIALCTVNEAADPAYANGRWEYHGASFRILHRFCVDPRHQGKGLGGRLLRRIEAELHAQGVEALRLDVFTENPTAQALYRRAGFRRVGQAVWRKGVFDLMEKRL